MSNWKIAQLERETSDGYVFTAHYTVFLQDGEYFASSYGSVGFQKPENLIPYNELTEEQVVEWVKTALGEEQVNSIETNLTNQINEQKNPTKASGLPWISPN